jgi:signal transduction histidine kinase
MEHSVIGASADAGGLANPAFSEAVIGLRDQPLTLATLPPGRTQRRLALAVVLALLVALFIAIGPISAFQLRRIDAFVPAYGTAVFLNDLITAVLLFNQFAIVRSRALLAIANGYLFTALIAIPWMLTFPGVFTPGGLLGAGLQTTNWLYNLWHAGFQMFVIAYALLKDADPPKGLWRGSASVAILSSVAVTAAVVCISTFLVTAGHARLPRTMLDPVRLSDLGIYITGYQVLLIVAVLVLLWIRRRSVLDLWLMVVVCAYAIETCLIAFPVPVRFTAGWYAGRVVAIVSSILVLLVLLHEIATLYAQLVRALLAQRSEREARLMTGDAVSASIAHEVKQPLTAMIASADAGLNWLNRVEPDLDSARKAFQRVATTGRRADVVINNIRAHFETGARIHTSIDIDDVIQEALALVRDNLQAHRVAVQATANERLPWIRGEQIQLQQVLVNLITNAIDSMAATDRERVLSIKSEVLHSGCVMVSVEDTGKGLEPSAVNQIFNPMFTTKTHGMGMGLSICRSIIEAHKGQLWVTAENGRGAIFHFTVPVDPDSAT